MLQDIFLEVKARGHVLANVSNTKWKMLIQQIPQSDKLLFPLLDQLQSCDFDVQSQHSTSSSTGHTIVCPQITREMIGKYLEYLEKQKFFDEQK